MYCKPLVTIGIPTYNRVKGLQRTLDCALKQSYENIEILIADNCTEPKAEIDALIQCLEQEKRIRYFRHSQNKGALLNFEFLLREARGEYFIWFCDDDYYDNRQLIEQYVTTLENSPSASFAMGAVEYVDGSGQMFIKDAPSYQMDGKLFHRMWVYLTTNITDNLMYGMFRTTIVKNYKFERDVSTPEKFLILYLLANGSLVDCFEASYKNVYSFKTGEEASVCAGNSFTRIHSVVWIKCAFRLFRFHQAIFFSAIYIFFKVPKLSWPVRKLFGLPKEHPGRTQILSNFKKEKLNNE